MRDTLPDAEYRRLFEKLPALVLVLWPDLTIAAASDEYLAATMSRREAVVGRGIFEMFADDPANPHATGVVRLRASLETVLRTRAAHTMGVQRYDLRRPEGTHEERYWSPRNVPVLDADGAVTLIIHRVEDVTLFVHARAARSAQEEATQLLQDHAERMEADVVARSRELHDANVELVAARDEADRHRAHLSALLARMDDGFVSVDDGGRIDSANAAAAGMLGAPAQALRGRAWEEVAREPEPGDGSAYRRALRTRRPTTTAGWREPGHRWLEQTLYPDADGGVAVFLRDATERRALEEVRTAYTRRLVTAQEEERRRIARELHDHMAQRLTALALGLRALETRTRGDAGGGIGAAGSESRPAWRAFAQLADDRLRTATAAAHDEALDDDWLRLNALVRQLIAEVQNLAVALRPPMLDEFGLVSALGAFVEEWSAAYGIAGTLAVTGLADRELAPDVEINVFRIAQEALTNVARHAEARQVSVVLERLDGSVRLCVDDDGVGFDEGEAAAGHRPRKLGLLGMRERAEMLGGAVRVTSSPGRGTSVRLTVPDVQLEAGPAAAGPDAARISPAHAPAPRDLTSVPS